MKIYYYLLFRLANWEKSCFGPIRSLFAYYHNKFLSKNIVISSQNNVWKYHSDGMKRFLLYGLLLLTQPFLSSEQNTRSHFEFCSPCLRTIKIMKNIVLSSATKFDEETKFSISHSAPLFLRTLVIAGVKKEKIEWIIN